MADSARFALAENPNGILYLQDKQHEFSPVTIDFADSFYRCRGGTEYLPKALRGMAGAHIADATAGWARDAWLLAYRGFRVTLIERHPLLFALLQQGIARAQTHAAIQQVAARMRVIHADSRDYLPAAAFDAVYLDPMYPSRDKSSKVKKDMQILHLLLANADGGEEALLAAALAGARRRVVVKRPQGAEPLASRAPDWQIHAPNTRFDVYRREPS